MSPQHYFVRQQQVMQDLTKRNFHFTLQQRFNQTSQSLHQPSQPSVNFVTEPTEELPFFSEEKINKCYENKLSELNKKLSEQQLLLENTRKQLQDTQTQYQNQLQDTQTQLARENALLKNQVKFLETQNKELKAFEARTKYSFEQITADTHEQSKERFYQQFALGNIKDFIVHHTQTNTVTFVKDGKVQESHDLDSLREQRYYGRSSRAQRYYASRTI